MKKLITLFAVVLFSFNSFAIAQSEVSGSDAEKPLEENLTVEQVLEVTENGIFLGDENAPVTIVEYASMSCPHCAQFHNDTFDDLKTKYIDTGKVKFVFRDFPLDEPALRGAMLSRCAGKEGSESYLKYLKVLFSTQQNWAPKKNYIEVLSNIAKLGGMKGEEFEACMADKEVETRIMTGKYYAAKFLEIRSTPSFYINGVLHRGAQNMKYLSEAIDGVLKGVNADISVEGEENTEGEAEEPTEEGVSEE